MQRKSNYRIHARRSESLVPGFPGTSFIVLSWSWPFSHPTKPHPTQPKTYLRAHLLGQNKGPCDARLARLLFCYAIALTKAQSRKRARRAADNEVIGLWLNV